MEAVKASDDVEQARTFWMREDVDEVFDDVIAYLDYLKEVVKEKTATDRELVQAFKLLQCLDLCPAVVSQDSPKVKVAVDSVPDKVKQVISHQSSPATTYSTPPSNGVRSPAALPAATEEVKPPMVQILRHQPHNCCKSCLPGVPCLPQSLPPFWGQNPLMVPLLCGFSRLIAVPRLQSRGTESTPPPQQILYRTPCGQTLCNYDDVMRFLLATGSYDVLQVDFFTFNISVQLDLPTPLGPRRPELDLSRGAEPTPVELCPGDTATLPADFRYRRDRWPHGCFLSRGSDLFSACCDCVDGCSDASQCACVALTRGGRHYTHNRLMEPVPSGVYECGPWCGCDRGRCQNRLVQRGIRVRLQVFQTDQYGWGVRCRDDLDRGTFVCIYAGLVLQRHLLSNEPTPPKLMRCDHHSDDEVEVVTEWLPPPILEVRSNPSETPLPKSPTKSPLTSPPLHVPVIQRPSDATATVHAPKVETSPPSGDRSQENVVVNGSKSSERRSLKRAVKVEDVYFLDASREGNVSRFFNHSCRPNMYVQNVFTDSHDRAFPIIAFFTSRVVKAGTELTWNYCDDSLTPSLQKEEEPCLCGEDDCRGRFIIEENLPDLCEVKGHAQMEAQ